MATRMASGTKHDDRSRSQCVSSPPSMRRQQRLVVSCLLVMLLVTCFLPSTSSFKTTLTRQNFKFVRSFKTTLTRQNFKCVSSFRRRASSMRTPASKNSSLKTFLSERLSMRDPKRYRENVCLQSTTSEDEVGGSNLDTERSLGLMVLLTVPLSWGTYGPVVKYLYEIQPPVPGFLFSAAYYMVASLSLLLLSAVQKDGDETKASVKAETPDSKGNLGLPILGGVELGTYLFLGNGLQILGLKTVPSDRAGFLVQLTTVMVPLMHAFLSGTGLKTIPIQTWIACLLAFSGVVVMELDGRDVLEDEGIFSALSAAFDSFSHGDLLIVLAAVVYTLHVVRLGKYAKETTAVKLATAKATAEAVLSVGLVLLLMAVGAASSVEGNGLLANAQELGREITSFFSAITNGIVSGKVPTSVLLPALGAVLWTGLVTCAYTIYAQTFGQQRVSPTDANLIYTLQPIFTALFAWGLLGETLGPAGFAGATLIGSAVYTAAMMNN